MSAHGFNGKPFRSIIADVKHPETGEWHHVKGWYSHYYHAPNPSMGALTIFSGPLPVPSQPGASLTEHAIHFAIAEGLVHEWHFGMGQWKLAEFGESF